MYEVCIIYKWLSTYKTCTILVFSSYLKHFSVREHTVNRYLLLLQSFLLKNVVNLLSLTTFPHFNVQRTGYLLPRTTVFLFKRILQTYASSFIQSFPVQANREQVLPLFLQSFMFNFKCTVNKYLLSPAIFHLSSVLWTSKCISSLLLINRYLLTQ